MDYEPHDDDVIEVAEEKFWTARRILFTLIVILTLIALLAYMLLPYWVRAPRPPQRPVPTLEYERV